MDFTALAAAPGTLIVLQPGQVHHFGDLADCAGWMLLFRPELLDPRATGGGMLGRFEAMQHLEDLPGRLQLSAAARPAVEETFARMASDGRGPATRSVDALLRRQLEALLIRLHLDPGAGAAEAAMEPAPLRRFRRFRALQEQDFARRHMLVPYARALGCSGKMPRPRGAHGVRPERQGHGHRPHRAGGEAPAGAFAAAGGQYRL